MTNNTGNTDQNQNLAKEDADFPEELKVRAREFFSKGEEVAYTLNYDYAIELYLEGLSIWPDSLDEGHKPLRMIALRRQAAGQKKSGFGDSSKYKKLSGKTPKEAMLKAEYLLCKEPGNAGHMADFAKAAAAGGYRAAANWIADLLFDLNIQKPKPSIDTYKFLKDIYVQIEVYNRALQACQLALQLKPGDTSLEDAQQDLSARATMQDGKYDTSEDFRDSIRDRDKQQKMHSQGQTVLSESSQMDVIALARQEYEADPQVPGKINKLVAALCTTDKIELENEAIEILEKAYNETKQFQHKQRSGEIRIKQANRQLRLLQKQLNADPQNETLRNKFSLLSGKVMETELDHYRLCVVNYPTDMGMRYEYGRRLLRAKQYDQAIPMFQEARSDPRHRLMSINFIGQCFFYKEWYADAVETFQQALEAVEDSESPVAKELRYNLGRAYEADGNVEEALNCFRKVAQIDYNYRDAKERVDTLRKKQRGEE